MRRWIVLPVKAPPDCKQRLAGVLGAAERQALVAAMLAHVVDTAGGLDADVLILGPERHGLPDGIPLVADPGGGLNDALTGARDAAIAAGVVRLVVVSPDLPGLTRDDLAALLTIAGATIGIAPDIAGDGTNALSLPLPAAAGFRFGYGEGSRARHVAQAARLGLDAAIVARPGLARDVDHPADLAGVWPLR